MRTVVNLEQALKSSNICCRNLIFFFCCEISVMRELGCVTLRNVSSSFLLWGDRPRRWSASPSCFQLQINHASPALGLSCISSSVGIKLHACLWKTLTSEHEEHL